MSENMPVWDTLICNALVFDGSGAAPRQLDIAVKDGRIAAKGLGLPQQLAGERVDADGQWLMPGLLDIHTHLDLEVELAPDLGEVVRHGTTTVVVGNCSLGTAFGSQLAEGQNPIVDCFARVENIPKHVLQRCVDRMDWDNTADYLRHLGSLPLGPNIVPLIPHSMLRVQVMGLERSIRSEPTADELARMDRTLGDAVDQGYVGFSTDSLPFHYLANDPHRDQRIPTQFASFDELKRLTGILRQYDRVWQATPDTANRLKSFARFGLTSGRLFGKPLRVSALAAMDMAYNRRLGNTAIGLCRLLNSRLLQGRIHFQALSTTFRVWGDGPTIPLFEEFESTSELLACDLEDREGRKRLLDDPGFVSRFYDDWYRGKRGLNVDRLLKLAGMPRDSVSRELADMIMDRCPVDEWCGESLQAIYDRLRLYQRSGGRSGSRSDEERAAFDGFPKPVADDAAFFLHLLRTWDREFRWYIDVANKDGAGVSRYLFDKHTLPGFNDSGAHLTNMAFYDGNLLTLQVAARESLGRVSEAVRRLTRAPAKFFGLDAGSLEIGARADITLVHPHALEQYDTDVNRKIIYRDLFENEQMVNRSDGVVAGVYIAGKLAWDGQRATPVLGRETLGQPLTFAGRAAA